MEEHSRVHPKRNRLALPAKTYNKFASRTGITRAVARPVICRASPASREQPVVGVAGKDSAALQGGPALRPAGTVVRPRFGPQGTVHLVPVPARAVGVADDVVVAQVQV